MRILVYPHDLALGGSQINAIELARAVADLGHEVTVFGRPGPLVERITAMGLDFVPSPRPRRRPSPTVTACLASVVRSRDIDVVHGYEWPPILEAWLAARRTGRVAVGTVMSMAVADFLPRTVPLLVGTRQIAEVERQAGRTAVDVLEPPVDLSTNHPELGLDTRSFRLAHGIAPEETLVVVVSRLAQELKKEGLVTAATVVGELAAERDVRLMIVGDGPARGELETLAATLAAGAPRPPVVLTGEMGDPRLAYAAADVALGMGSSALRAMAFGTPVIVQGEEGFWRTLRPDTLDQFLWTGWYGVGPGQESGADALRAEILPLLLDPGLRARLGAFSADVVRGRFSLGHAAQRQVQQYSSALQTGPRPGDPWEVVRSGGRFVGYTGRRLAERLRGQVRTDDFNARPVAARARTEIVEHA